MCHNKNGIGEEGKGKPPHEFHFPRKNSEPCLWFLLCLKSSVQCSSKVDLLPSGKVFALHVVSRDLSPLAEAPKWFMLQLNLHWYQLASPLNVLITGFAQMYDLRPKESEILGP